MFTISAAKFLLIPYHSLCFFFRQLFAGSGPLIYNKCYHQPGITGFLVSTASRDTITKLQYSLALDLSFFVLGKHHLKHTIFLPSTDQIVPSIWSLNCSPTSELPDHVERYSRKVFVGGLPPDIDEG